MRLLVAPLLLLLGACSGAPSAPQGTASTAGSPPVVSEPATATSSASESPITAIPPEPEPVPPDGVRRFEVPAATSQVVLVTASSWSDSEATLTTLERSDEGWRSVVEVPARLGSAGLVDGTERVQGSRTTPAGMYPLTSAFGRDPDPGTALPYTVVGPDHWWVGDVSSPHYNEMRLASQGGFEVAEPSEQLVEYDPQYDHAVVIDFNRPEAVPGRGAAIFLHVNGSGATAGCVSIAEPDLEEVLRWLDPGSAPVTVIGPTSWLDEEVER